MKRTASWLTKRDVFLPIEPQEGGAWLEVLSYPKIADGKVYFQCGIYGFPMFGQRRVSLDVGRLVEINEVA